MIGRLQPVPALSRPDLLGAPVLAALRSWGGSVPVDDIQVAAIDPDVADTAAFCLTYEVPPEVSANCVIVAGRRGGETRLAACVVLAATRADVNGVVRRHLDARKCSFAATDMAVAETGMEYGGITPIGLPPRWPVLVDAAVDAADGVVVGSGLRRSKLWVPGRALASLPGGSVVAHLSVPA